MRAAKAAKRGGRLRVGAQPVALDPHVVEVVGIARMQHRPVGHRQGQVQRPAAAGEMGELQPQDAAGPVESAAVVDTEIVPLAGDQEIVVAVIAHLAGPPGDLCCDRTGHGQVVALALLAAEPAAHAPRLHPHRMHRHAERVGHLVLDLGRVLGRGMDMRAAIFGRQGERCLPFEVEMLLPADRDAAVDAVGCCGHGLHGVADPVDARAVLEPVVAGQRVLDAQHRRTFVDLCPGPAGRPARGQMRCGSHEKQRLAQVMNLARAEQRFVMVRGRTVRRPREIRCGQHRDHPRRLPNRAQIERGQRSGRRMGKPEGQMQRVRRRGNVVDIPGRTRDMQPCRVMGQGLRHRHGATRATCP